MDEVIWRSEMMKRRVIGNLMIVAPFVGLAVYFAQTIGWQPTLLIFVGSAFLLGWMRLAIELAS